jgi:hypothetical protein
MRRTIRNDGVSSATEGCRQRKSNSKLDVRPDVRLRPCGLPDQADQGESKVGSGLSYDACIKKFQFGPALDT